MAARRKGLWIAGIVVAAIVVVVVGFVVVSFVLREDPGAKSVEEALEELDEGGSGEDGDVVSGPEPGVYRAEGEGTESLSVPPVSQHDGAVMPVSVERPETGCWRVKIDYNEAHWQSWLFCEQDGVIVERGGETYQRWDFGAITAENTSTFVCDPSVMIDPDAEPGARWEQSCTGTSSATAGTTISAGPYEFVGIEEVVIGGVGVPARRYHQERSLSEAQQGTTVTELWFAVDTGLPLRMERETHVESDSPVGRVTYTESGHWQLASLTPER